MHLCLSISTVYPGVEKIILDVSGRAQWLLFSESLAYFWTYAKKNQLKSFILRKIVVSQNRPPRYIYTVIQGTWSFSTGFSRNQPKCGVDYLSEDYKPGDGTYCFI